MTVPIRSNIYVENETGFTSKATLLVDSIGKKDAGHSLLEAIKQGSKAFVIMHDPNGIHYGFNSNRVIIFHPGDDAESLEKAMQHAYEVSTNAEEISLSTPISNSSGILDAKDFVIDLLGTHFHSS